MQIIINFQIFSINRWYSKYPCYVFSARKCSCGVLLEFSKWPKTGIYLVISFISSFLCYLFNIVSQWSIPMSFYIIIPYSLPCLSTSLFTLSLCLKRLIKSKDGPIDSSNHKILTSNRPVCPFRWFKKTAIRYISFL